MGKNIKIYAFYVASQVPALEIGEWNCYYQYLCHLNKIAVNKIGL